MHFFSPDEFLATRGSTYKFFPALKREHQFGGCTKIQLKLDYTLLVSPLLENCGINCYLLLSLANRDWTFAGNVRKIIAGLSGNYVEIIIL